MEAFARLPLAFEKQGDGVGQKFIARGQGYVLGLDAGKATIGAVAKNKTIHAISLEFGGARPRAAVAADELPGKTNYILGNDPKKWRIGLPTYARVAYPDTYPGIDVVYYGNQRQLEFDVVVKPGADPRTVRMKVNGGALSLGDSGELKIAQTGGLNVEIALPKIYQELNGTRTAVAGRYAIRGADEVAFEVESYDRSRALVIDPTIVYSTLLGGETGSSQAFAIAVDSAGEMFVAGGTFAVDFPAVNAWQGVLKGVNENGFVSKLNAAGTALIYSTYLGGSEYDYFQGIAVDATSGAAWVTGITYSSDFPLLNPVQATYGGAAVAKLSASGALEFSTYLGNYAGSGQGIAVDTAGNAYVVGATGGLPFSTTAGAFQTTSAFPLTNGSSNAFVAKLSASGSEIYATLLGGTACCTQGNAIAADSNGDAWVTGYTYSAIRNAPTSGVQPVYQGGGDAFIAELNPAGSAMPYFTFLGGAGYDAGNAVALDGKGNVFVAGVTYSSGIATAGAAQTALTGGADGFIAKLNIVANAFSYISYLGGGRTQTITGLAIDGSGNAIVAGYTDSTDFPMVAALDSAFPGNGASLFATQNSGASWAAADSGVGGAVYDISPSAAGSTVVLTEAGIYRTAGTGAPFTRQLTLFQGSGGLARSAAAPTTIYALYAVSAFPPSPVIIAPYSGVVYRSTDDGVTWSLMGSAPVNTSGILAYPLAADTVYAFSAAGISRTTDGGATWNSVPAAFPGGVNAMAGASDGSLYAAVEIYGVYKGTGQSESWTEVNSGISSGAYGVAHSLSASGTTVYFADGAIYETTNGGSAWSTTAGFIGALQVAASPGNASVLYALDDTGYNAVHTSIDGGATWNTVPVTGLSGNLQASNSEVVADPSNSANAYLVTPVNTAAFAAKLNSAGSSLIWSTYLGNTGATYAFGAASDGSGNAYVTGYTNGSGFPITASSLPFSPSTTNAFVTKLSDAAATCSVTVTPASVVAPVNGTTPLLFEVVAPSGCSWTASSTDTAQIMVVSGASGTGVGTVAVITEASGTTQSATLTIGNQNVTIILPGSLCGNSYSLDQNTYAVPAAGGTVNAVLTTGAGCPWALTNDSPLAVVVTSPNPAQGSGSATISLSVAPNPGVSSRQFSLPVGNTAINIGQAGSCLSLSSSSNLNVDVSGLPLGNVAVNANGNYDCSWRAESSASWLSIAALLSSTGSGVVGYSVSANSGAARSAFLNIGGLIFTVTQMGNNSPTITGITNGADFSPPPLAPGSLASLFGMELSGTTLTSPSVSSVPLPTSLGNVIVTVNGIAAPLQFVSPTQINLQIPYETATGNATVIVNNNGVESNSFQLLVAAAAPGIFASIIQNSNLTLNSASLPASPGTGATVYFTGAGAVTPAVADGTAAAGSPLSRPNAAVSVTVGGLSASPTVFVTPGSVGVVQANITIPSMLPTGSYPVVIIENGVASAPALIYVSVPPQISSVAPSLAPSGSAATMLTINGSNFGAGSTVMFTPPGGPATTLTLGSVFATQIVTTIPATLLNTVGTAEIDVSNGNGLVSNQVPFYIYPLIITNVAPGDIPVGSGPLQLFVAGPNLTTATRLIFTPPGGAPCTIALPQTSMSVVFATVPAACLTTAGTAQVALANSAGALSNSLPFHITPFTITKVTPNAAPAGSGPTPVTIAGQGLSLAATLSFTPPGGSPVTIPLSMIQAAQAAATIPAAYMTSAGTAQMALANSAGAFSNQLPFTISSGQAPETIVFEPISSQALGSPPVTIAATASSGLGVGLVSNTPSICTLSGGTISLGTTGYCSITASQGGNGIYGAAMPVTRAFDVTAALGQAGTLAPDSAGPFGAGPNPYSITVGDFNNDGNPDLVITNAYGFNTVTVLLGNGMGGFTEAGGSPFMAGPEPRAVAVGDFNGDGNQDLAVADYEGGSVTLLLGNGLGGFTPAAGSPFATGPYPSAVAVADFNGDGNLDLATANFGSENVTILLGNGSGGFTAAPDSPVAVPPDSGFLAAADFNGDGIPDLVVNSGVYLTVLLGSGTGEFTTAPGSPFVVPDVQGLSLGVGDFNGDGKPDLAGVGLGYSTVNFAVVLLGNGMGGFAMAPGSPFSVGNEYTNLATGDFNGDGRLDLALSGSVNVEVLLGNGAGGFTGSAGPFVVAGNSIATGNFNGDGKLDLVVSNGNNASSSVAGAVSVLLGASAPTNSLLSTTSPLTIPLGEPVPLTLTVSDTTPAFSAPTGIVTFLDGTTTLGTSSETTGLWTFSASGLSAGSHTLTAVYGSDARSLSSTSNSITIQVNASLPYQTISFGALPNQFLGSSPPPLSATATSGLTVTFTSNSLPVCTVSGVTITLLTVGTCSITASQAGNSTYPAATPVTQTFTVSAAVLPVAAFLDQNGAPALTFDGSTNFPDSGGVLTGVPGVAQAPNGDTWVVGLDSAGGVHLNHYSYASSAWSGWEYSGGTLDTGSGLTATVAPNGVVWFAGRDIGNRYWINSWDGGVFGGWILMADGIFSSDSIPQIAIPSDGTVYVIGKDIGGRIWSNSYNRANQTFTGWVDRQAVMIGQPSATAGQDGMVYVAVRSVSSESPVYITQIPAQNAAAANTWLNGGGLVDTDPQITSQGGTVYLMALADDGTVYLLTFAESNQTFGAWNFTNGILNDATITGQGGNAFIAGRDSADRIYWYSVTGNTWFFADGAGISSTVLAGAK